jgi:hypothetical protein
MAKFLSAKFEQKKINFLLKNGKMNKIAKDVHLTTQIFSFQGVLLREKNLTLVIFSRNYRFSK